MNMRIAHIIIFASLVVAVLASPCQSLAAGQANFTLSPVSINQKAGENFNLNLQVSTGSTKIDALEINLKFDPSKLELTAFQPTNTFNAEVKKIIDNKAGSLSWTTADIAKPRKVLSGDINLGTLTFKTKESGQSAISFTKAEAGSIDTGLTSTKNSVQVNITGSQGLFQRFAQFIYNLLNKN